MSGSDGKDSQRDLRHFLNLASSQLKNKLAELEAKEPYSAGRMNQMRMLEELIKEQIPNENSGRPARTSR